uniref:SUF system FeS assembly protein, NifU family n=1 Tax=Magnetococcus massalia (strain MO-1) TaxID=451514 RepID=A0A1S7LG98_MAGMO|nr:SUF system FeS assembly protein, NifU family [Candidatus Magnetococcus massalia]
MMNAFERGLYEETILDHNRHPRFYPAEPVGATHHGYGFNPICGDEFHLHLLEHDGVLTEVGFEGAGCSISTATCSLMLEHLKGQTHQEAERLFELMHALLTGPEPDPEVIKQLGKLRVLLGVRAFPSRIKCATLGWHILHAALSKQMESVCTE